MIGWKERVQSYFLILFLFCLFSLTYSSPRLVPPLSKLHPTENFLSPSVPYMYIMIVKCIHVTYIIHMYCTSILVRIRMHAAYVVMHHKPLSALVRPTGFYRETHLDITYYSQEATLLFDQSYTFNLCSTSTSFSFLNSMRRSEHWIPVPATPPQPGYVLTTGTTIGPSFRPSFRRPLFLLLTSYNFKSKARALVWSPWSLTGPSSFCFYYSM
jgi:hypothetical protein